MTLVTYPPPPEKKSKKVGELFEDRNTNVVTLQRQKREGKAVVARDRLSRFRDSLIREIISCIKVPYQLYKIS